MAEIHQTEDEDEAEVEAEAEASRFENAIIYGSQTKVPIEARRAYACARASAFLVLLHQW